MNAVAGVPGLIYVADWLDATACSALTAAIDAGEWSTQLRRRVQHYGHRYDYGSRSVASNADTASAPPFPAWAAALAARLAEYLPEPPDQAIVNEYEPGQGISAHVDCVPCFGPVVAAVSLGSPCVMDFTLPGEGAKVPVRLDPGSLCVMTGPARYAWRHAIAARKSDPSPAGRVPRGRRLSVTYRSVLTPTPGRTGS
jgi:alkylated DNA repair dioxygenase AlkB